MQICITVYHPTTNKVVFQTTTDNIMLFADKLTPYDEQGYTIHFAKVKA